jgi:hypothetical protein
MRALLLLLGLATIGLAAVSWELNTGRTTTETVSHAARSSAPGQQALQVTKSTQAASSSLRSESVTVALIALGGAFILGAAFWDRLSEFGFAGMTVKLLDPKILKELRERAEDPDKALEAWELFLTKLQEAEKRGERVSGTMTEEAIDLALSEVSFNPEDSIEVSDDGEPQLVVDGGETARGPALRVTTEEQYLPAGQFSERFLATMDRSLQEHHAQRLYILDVQLLEVLAVLVFELPAGHAPVVLHALGSRVDREDLDARCLGAALIGTRYLHHAAAMLGRPSGVFIDTQHPDQTELAQLWELRFRIAAPEEIGELPPSEYWVQYPDS